MTRVTTMTGFRAAVRPGLLVVLLPFLVFSVQPLLAQTRANEAFDHDLRVSLEDAGTVFSAPARFDGEDWLYVALTLGATAAAYTVDDDIYAELRSQPVGDWDLPLAVGQWYGSGVVSGALGAGLYVVGLAGDDDHTRITGRMVLQSFAYSVVITQILKTVTGRARPSMGQGKDEFTWFSFRDDYHSFPSGHSTAAFALSSTLSRRIGSLPLSIVLYALATLTVAERIGHDRHWFSDTVLGAVIGSVVGIAVVRLEEERVAGMRLTVPLQFGSDRGEAFGRHRPLLVWSVGL